MFSSNNKVVTTADVSVFPSTLPSPQASNPPDEAINDPQVSSSMSATDTSDEGLSSLKKIPDVVSVDSSNGMSQSPFKSLPGDFNFFSCASSGSNSTSELPKNDYTALVPVGDSSTAASPSPVSSQVFCCRGIAPYKPRRTDHEDLFSAFQKREVNGEPTVEALGNNRAVQVIKQQNFGPVLAKRYFTLPNFEETSESEFISDNYKRLNSFKNYKCGTHNLFFEVNAYRKAEAVSHHHTSTIDGRTYSRDSAAIDLGAGTDKGWWSRG